MTLRVSPIAEKSPRAPRIAQMAPMPSKTESISFRIQAPSGEMIHIKSRTNIKCNKIYKAVAAHLGIQEDAIRCTFDGQRLQHDDLLDSYDIEEGDVIDCLLEQIGG